MSIIRTEDEALYSMTEPIVNEPKCMKCHGNKKIIAYVDIDTYLTRAERNFYTGSVHLLYLAIVIIFLLIIGFYFLFNKFINKPLHEFLKALEEVEKGNLSTRLQVNRHDEFGILDTHFNKMVSNLEKSKTEIENLHYSQLQRADKLVTLGELAAEIAHEINNPIAIILSRVDYLQMLATEEKEIKQYSEDFDTIQSQITKISKITGSILKYSKKCSKDFKLIELTGVMEESLKTLGPLMEKYRLSLKRIIKSMAFIFMVMQPKLNRCLLI